MDWFSSRLIAYSAKLGREYGVWGPEGVNELRFVFVGRFSFGVGHGFHVWGFGVLGLEEFVRIDFDGCRFVIPTF